MERMTRPAEQAVEEINRICMELASLRARCELADANNAISDRRLMDNAAELAQLRAANAEWQRKHGLLVAEVRAWRDQDWRLSNNHEGIWVIQESEDAPMMTIRTRDAIAATDAGGAMEVGG